MTDSEELGTTLDEFLPTSEDDTVEPLERKRVSDIIHRAYEPLTFLIDGFLVDGTHGMLAGPQKSLKTYIGTFIDLALLSGEPLWNHFDIGRSGPVVVFVGEGGEIPYLRRVDRIRKALGLDESVLEDYHIFTQTAPLDSELFQTALRDALDEVKPVLVRIDPYYAFHGGVSDSKNLHAEGAHLNKVSQPVQEAGSNLLITNHFNQTSKSGAGWDDPRRITLVGGAEWVDSWFMVEKTSEDEQDVTFGRFRLKFSVNSRQWGGTKWVLNLSIGWWNPKLGEHDGDISWSLEQLTASPDVDTGIRSNQRTEAIEMLTDMPWELNRTKYRGLSKYKTKTVSDFIQSEVRQRGPNQLIMEVTLPNRKKALGLNVTHPDADGWPEMPPGSKVIHHE